MISGCLGRDMNDIYVYIYILIYSSPQQYWGILLKIFDCGAILKDIQQILHI